MKISKKDALAWFEFFAQLPEGEHSRSLFMLPLRRSRLQS